MSKTAFTGPYATARNADGSLRVDYTGNRLLPRLENALAQTYDVGQFAQRVTEFHSNKIWPALTRLHHAVFMATSEYFHGRGACFVPLPLTTRMISSPGAYFDRKHASYTVDVKPVTLEWFEEKRPIFLSESSQIYLELTLAQNEIDEAFSICSSFRNEQSNALHLAEFHHIEYEGKLGQEQMEGVAVGLLAAVARRFVSRQAADLKDALDALYRDTKNERYRTFTLEGTLGSAEETRLTEIYGGLVGLRKFPLMEVPFYHAQVPESSPATAKNTDLLWPGYNEIIGSGERINTAEELREKGRLFDVPEQDYEPYVQTRTLPGYKTTSGFGLGWERLVQALLRMPCIWTAMPFPRVSGAVVN